MVERAWSPVSTETLVKASPQEWGTEKLQAHQVSVHREVEHAGSLKPEWGAGGQQP